MSQPKPWTDADQAFLIKQFVPEKLVWAGIQLPEGRTLNGCQKFMAKWRRDLGLSVSPSKPAAKGPGNTPKKKAVRIKKPKSEDGSSDDDDDDVKPEPTPTKPKRKRSAAPVKFEDEGGEQSDGPDEDPDVARKKRKTGSSKLDEKEEEPYASHRKKEVNMEDSVQEFLADTELTRGIDIESELSFSEGF